jgi:glycerophosphoryl diester phosphodiesterase
VARLVARAEQETPEDLDGTGPGFSALLVSSFDPPSIDLVRQLDPRLCTAPLAFEVDSVPEWLAQTAAAGHVAVNPWDGLVDADLVERAHAAQLEVNVWTVDDPDRMADLVGFGVDGIITNVPDVARRVIDHR